MCSRRDIDRVVSIADQFLDEWAEDAEGEGEDLLEANEAMERARPLILAATTMYEALEAALYALNAIPNRRLNGPQTNTYDVARLIDQALAEARKAP